MSTEVHYESKQKFHNMKLVQSYAQIKFKQYVIAQTEIFQNIILYLSFAASYLCILIAESLRLVSCLCCISGTASLASSFSSFVRLADVAFPDVFSSFFSDFAGLETFSFCCSPLLKEVLLFVSSSVIV